ncbi:MAG TPA: RNA polymerase sigma factor [Burkholderiaceae bacterium]|nr:RNA polymerase sigma factor [Burkholderiaceae bacterium]
MAIGFSAADAERLIPRLRRYALALTGTREAADDLTQDTLERAWRKRALWQPGSDLRAWLFTVMHNVYVNGVRTARPVESLDDERFSADHDRSWTQPDAVEAQLALSDVKAAFGRLSDDHREVLLLVGVEQLSYVEAAAVLEVPIGTVMSRLARGREQLRRLLSSEATAAVPPALRRVK